MQSNKEVVDKFTRQRKMAKKGLSAQYDNTILCQDYYNNPEAQYSDQIQFNDAMGRKRKARVQFMKIGQSVDSIVGFMAQNRRQAKFVSRVNEAMNDQLYSRNMNALYIYHRDNMNADQLESRQDLDMVVNGYGAIDTDLSYIVGRSTQMPGGEIIKMRVDPLKVYWDPAAKSPNALDARFIGYSIDYELKDALNLFQADDESEFEPIQDSDADEKGGYQFNPWGGLYDKIKLDNTVEWSAREENMVRVYNHQWFEYETFYRAPNPVYETQDFMLANIFKSRLDSIKDGLKSYLPDGIDAGDLFDFDPMAKVLTFDGDTKAKLVKEFGEMIKPIPFQRKCYYTAVISGKHVFTKFKNVSQQGFTVKLKTGQYNERGKFWLGMVNGMIEPQKYYNKSLTELMFTIASNSKGGVLVERGAVEDIEDFEENWAKTDAVIQVEDGAIAGGKIMEKAKAAIPTGLNDIITLSEKSIYDNGVDPAFLGQSNAQETGILFKRRIRQVMSKMWWVADAGTLFQKEDARLCADLIRVWIQNNTGEVMRITGQDGLDQFMQISEDMLAPEYDIEIQEAADSPEDKEDTAQLISGIGDKYLGVGDTTRASALHSEAIQMLSLDGDVKARLTKVLLGDQQTVPMAQYQQLQQQIQALQNALTQAQADELVSRAELNRARIPDVIASARQKGASAVKDLEEAKQTHIESSVIRTHAASANINI